MVHLESALNATPQRDGNERPAERGAANRVHRKPLAHPDDGLVSAVCYVFSRIEDAEALAAQLVAAGIPAVPRIDYFNSSDEGDHRPAALRVSVVVPVAQTEAARAVIAESIVPEGTATEAEIEAALHAHSEPPLPVAVPLGLGPASAWLRRLLLGLLFGLALVMAMRRCTS